MHRIPSSCKIPYYIKKYDVMRYFSTSEPVFTLHHYLPGELLASPFEECEFVQIIVEGELLLYEMPSEDSFSMVHTPYYHARLIGEIELFNPSFQTFFVEAKTDVFTLALSYKEYREKLLHDCVFLLSVCQSLAEKLEHAVQTGNKIPLKAQVLKYISLANPAEPIQDINHFSHMFHVSQRQMIRTLNELCAEQYLTHPKKGTYLIATDPNKQ